MLANAETDSDVSWKFQRVVKRVTENWPHSDTHTHTRARFKVTSTSRTYLD